MRFLITVLFAVVCAVVSAAPALAAATIKIEYSMVYDRIRPQPQKNVRVTAKFDVALAEDGEVKENITRAAGNVSDSFKKGVKLGGGQWDVISEKELQRTINQPQSTLVITITMVDDKSCTMDVKWTLKPGFNEFKFRRITDGSFAFFTEPKVQSKTCTIQ
jgi:hypothetical protein